MTVDSTDWTRRSVLRTISGAAIGGTLALGGARTVTGQSAESWPQFGYNNANTGHAPENTGPVADIEEQWSFQVENSVWSSPAVADGTVYVGDEGVHALDAGSGEEQWHFQAAGFVVSEQAIVDNTVYVGSLDTNVYAVDAESGTEQWSFGTGGEVWSSPTVVDGTVFVGGHDNNLYALDAEAGTEQWSFQTGDSVDSSPAVVDGLSTSAVSTTTCTR